MKNIVSILILSILIASCQEHNQKAESAKKDVAKTTQKQDNNTIQQDGQSLFKQYCMSCHLAVPDPSKRDKMLAPPMVRVVQHYKGTYTDKKDFVKAVVNWANKPSEDAVLMPGAARKFGLMPPMPIGQEKLEQIAGYIYDADFGHFGSMKHQSKGSLQLNNGKKYALDKHDVAQVHKAVSLLQNTDIKDVAEYRQTGKKVFDAARDILLNKKYEGKTLQQVQLFFHNIEDDMHHLMSVETKTEGEKYRKIVLNKMLKFDRYFSTKG